jgi:hypothetical protein
LNVITAPDLYKLTPFYRMGPLLDKKDKFILLKPAHSLNIKDLIAENAKSNHVCSD